MFYLCVFSRPNGLIYQKFRNQFLAFSIFQSEYSSPVEEEGPGPQGILLMRRSPEDTHPRLCGGAERVLARSLGHLSPAPTQSFTLV